MNFSNLVGSKAEVAPAPAAPAPAPVAAPAADVRPAVTQKVLASVARISAFPASTLKTSQTLVGELGFDSLMLVELDGDVGKAFPQLGGLPRELFSKTTTVGSVIDHVVKALEGGAAKPAAAEAPAAAAQGPVDRYLPTVVPAPLHSVSESVHAFRHPLLVTSDGLGLAERLVAALQAHGVAAVTGDATAGKELSGVIHLEALRAEGEANAPARRLLALAQGLDAEKAECFITVTGLGGRFGGGHRPVAE